MQSKSEAIVKHGLNIVAVVGHKIKGYHHHHPCPSKMIMTLGMKFLAFLEERILLYLTQERKQQMEASTIFATSSNNKHSTCKKWKVRDLKDLLHQVKQKWRNHVCQNKKQNNSKDKPKRQAKKLRGNCNNTNKEC